MQDEQAGLTEQVTRARAAAENRFAGIELTGRRVVFLVDISGSMQYVDAETLAPAKWPGVRDAIVRILKSLPDLAQFQLIVFSDKEADGFGGNTGCNSMGGKATVAETTITFSEVFTTQIACENAQRMNIRCCAVSQMAGGARRAWSGRRRCGRVRP